MFVRFALIFLCSSQLLETIPAAVELTFRNRRLNYIIKDTSKFHSTKIYPVTMTGELDVIDGLLFGMEDAHIHIMHHGVSITHTLVVATLFAASRYEVFELRHAKPLRIFVRVIRFAQ